MEGKKNMDIGTGKLPRFCRLLCFPSCCCCPVICPVTCCGLQLAVLPACDRQAG